MIFHNAGTWNVSQFTHVVFSFSAVFYGTWGSKGIMQIVVTCDFWVSVIQLKLYMVGDALASHVIYFAEHNDITQTSPNITCLLC